MPDVPYKGYTIKLKSGLQHKGSKWEPFAIVWYKDGELSIGHPLAIEALQDTEAEANVVALECAKAWVEARESRNPPRSTL
jgi:hypothetical protein